MDGPRAPSNEEFSQVVSFLTQNLRKDINWSIADEYPLALNTGNLSNIRVVKEGDRYVSGAVVRTSMVKSPAGLFKVAGIGSVVTAPDYRNRGLSRSVLDSVLQIAKESACDVAILWTDIYDFYRKVGFELGGTEISAQFDAAPKVDATGLKFVESPKVSAEAIARIYAQHTCGSIRSIEDIRKSLTIPNMRVYTAWDSSGQMQAYAIEGKGADLNGYIHEWGGSVSKILPLLGHIIETQKKSITIIAPIHAKNLLRQLQSHGAQLHQGVLGMIKVVNPYLLFAKVRRYARNIGIDDFVLEQRNGQAHFGFGNEVFKTDSESDVVRLIFGPSKASELHQFDPVTAAGLETIFPLPFWIWGWDSV